MHSLAHVPSSVGALLLMLMAGSCASSSMHRQVDHCMQHRHRAACKAAGDAFRQGTGGAPRHLGAAAALYRRSCLQRQAGGCTQLALLSESGDGLPRDTKLAASLLDSACRLGDAWACGRLAYFYEHGIGVARDITAAVSLLRQACAATHAWSCGALARRLEDGDGVPADPLAATVLYRKACKGDMLWACNRLPVAKRTLAEEAWLIRFRSAIRARWDVTQLAHQIPSSATEELQVTLRISLDPAGVVKSITVEDPAREAINESCMAAVRAAQPFPDPPECWRRGDVFKIRFACRYDPGPPRPP